ncbi:MFS transporter [Eubacteriales bacterium SGI.150]
MIDNTQTTVNKPWTKYITMLVSYFAILIVLSMNTPVYPSLSAEFGISSALISWSSAAYSMSAAILAPIMGRLGDLFGLKRITIFGLADFVVATAVIAMGPNYWIVLGGRFFQGIAIASVVPCIMSFAGRFIPAKDITKAYSLLGGIATCATIFGPTLSGFIVANWGWRAVFGFGAVFVALATVLVFIMLPSIPKAGQVNVKFDIPGSVTLFISVGALLIIPTLANQIGWTAAPILVLGIIFVVFLILFIFRERSTDAPVVNLSLFKKRNFILPSVMFFMLNGFTNVWMYMLGYYLTGRGISSTTNGLWMSFVFVIMTAAALLVSRMLSTLNWKLCAFVPVVINAAACCVFGLCGREAPIALLFVGGAFVGLSGAFNTPLPSGSAMAGISASEQGSVSGTLRLMGDLGAPLFVAIYLPLLSTFNNVDGVPDYASAFPKVSMLLLVSVAIMLVLAICYPSHDPKQAQAE